MCAAIYDVYNGCWAVRVALDFLESDITNVNGLVHIADGRWRLRRGDDGAVDGPCCAYVIQFRRSAAKPSAIQFASTIAAHAPTSVERCVLSCNARTPHGRTSSKWYYCAYEPVRWINSLAPYAQARVCVCVLYHHRDRGLHCTAWRTRGLFEHVCVRVCVCVLIVLGVCTFQII